MGEVMATLAMVQQQCIAQPAVRVWQTPAPQNQPSSSVKWQQVQVQVPSSPPAPSFQAPASPYRRKVLISLGGALAAVGIGGVLCEMLSHSTSQAIATPDQTPTIPSAPPQPTPQPQEGFQKLSGGGDAYMGHVAPVLSIAWSPDGKYIVSGFFGAPALVWDATSGNTVLTYQGLTNYVECLTWSPDGKRIAFGSSDHTVQVWNAP